MSAPCAVTRSATDTLALGASGGGDSQGDPTRGRGRMLGGTGGVQGFIHAPGPGQACAKVSSEFSMSTSVWDRGNVGH